MIVTENGKQRYRCNNPECSRKTFVEKYTYKACDPYIRSRVFFATVNGDGCRAILGINKDSVGNILKTVESDIWNVNYDYIERHKDIQAELVQVNEAEFDEMWSFYHDKSRQIWLWWAITQANRLHFVLERVNTSTLTNYRNCCRHLK